MSKFIDVQPKSWYYNDVEELSSLMSYDNTPFFTGIEFTEFSPGMEAIDYTIIYPNVGINSNTNVVVESESSFILNKAITVSEYLPLTVLVDGIIVGVDDVKKDVPEVGKTYVKLKRSVGLNSIVRFLYSGQPELEWRDESDLYEKRLRPLQPTVSQKPEAILDLDSGCSYLYDPYDATIVETVKIYGRPLKRVNSESDITNEEVYTINESGKLIVYYTLNNETLEASYIQIDGADNRSLKCSMPTPRSSSMLYTDRFFPELVITRAEVITTLDKMRVNLIRRYTDQETFLVDKDYKNSRFEDVKNSVDEPWYWRHLKNLEEIKEFFGTDLEPSYLITGYANDNVELGYDFKANRVLTRAEMVALLERFRKWFINALK